MNREEILNLPDEVINTRIATEWMGWLSFDVKGVKTWFIEETRDYRLKSEWSPSTNLSDAMEALEKVKVDKKVSRCIIEITKEDYFVTVISPDYFPNDRVIVKDKSLPKAICLCILLYLKERIVVKQ